jgi:hypothetical protein
VQELTTRDAVVPELALDEHDEVVVGERCPSDGTTNVSRTLPSRLNSSSRAVRVPRDDAAVVDAHTASFAEAGQNCLRRK